jgi:hypothetical protein
MNAYRFVELQREVSPHSIPSFALKTQYLILSNIRMVMELIALGAMICSQMPASPAMENLIQHRINGQPPFRIHRLHDPH